VGGAYGSSVRRQGGYDIWKQEEDEEIPIHAAVGVWGREWDWPFELVFLSLLSIMRGPGGPPGIARRRITEHFWIVLDLLGAPDCQRAKISAVQTTEIDHARRIHPSVLTSCLHELVSTGYDILIMFTRYFFERRRRQKRDTIGRPLLRSTLSAATDGTTFNLGCGKRGTIATVSLIE